MSTQALGKASTKEPGFGDSPHAGTAPVQNDGFEFRADVKRIWDEFQRIEKSREFGNLEGGSVEQHRDRRLQLHHCANYAAVLNVLRDGHADRLGTRSESSDDSVMSRAPLRLLEFGCGSGVLTSALAHVMPDGWTIEATDYSEHLLARARERFERDGLSFGHLDVRSIRPEHLDEIDAVLLLEVIEHLPPDEAEGLLHRVYDALPAGGMMVLTTLDRSPFPRPFSGYAPHCVEFTYRSLTQMLENRHRNPFEEHHVYRLVSGRITAESVRSEQRGGYFMNRLQGMILNLGRRQAEFGALVLTHPIRHTLRVRLAIVHAWGSSAARPECAGDVARCGGTGAVEGHNV